MSASRPSNSFHEPPPDLCDIDANRTGIGMFSATRLEAIYRDHAARLMRHFARSVGREDASDVVQEAFAKLARPSDGREPVECPESFVTAIATNVLRDRARAAARRALHHHRLAQEPQQNAPDPHRMFEDREAVCAIERALADMNPRRRRIFMLHRFEDLTYAEIGGAVGMSEKGVKKQMAKALVELRLAVDRPA